MRRPLRLLAALPVLLLAATLAHGAGAAPGGKVGFRLSHTSITPKHPYFDGVRKVRLHYRFAASRPVDLRIQVVSRRTGDTVARWHERRARPGAKLQRAWNGITDSDKVAHDGLYGFRIEPAGGRGAGAGSFPFHGHVFPVDGPHGTRGPIGDFGAPRSGGRVHEGFDVTGDCGTPLSAARGGVVAKVGYDPVLYGNYVLIDGAKTSQDYFYAHMVEPSEVAEGGRVRTGQEVGRIGLTGNAAGTPCHLHFEIRVHGQPIDPEPALRRWDGYS